MKRFIIETIYEEDDEEFLRDELEVRLIDMYGKVILKGDHYHNNINSKIDGFFACLDYLGIEYTINEIKKNEEH